MGAGLLASTLLFVVFLGLTEILTSSDSFFIVGVTYFKLTDAVPT